MMMPLLRRIRPLPVSLLCLLCLLSLALAACGAAGVGSGGGSTPPPTGWTDITPPDTGQITHYAISPDIPGLILAVIGGHTQASADPPATARLWRSTDGGASWELLDSLSVRTSVALDMPAGGHGLVFAVDQLANNVFVSANAGTTWRSLPTSMQPGASPQGWPFSAVVVAGRLYAGGITAGFGGMPTGTSRFVVSDDHGQTWRTVEASADPAGANMTTDAIAPLDTRGSAWLRLVSNGYGYATQYAVERSDDGGVSWRILSRSLPLSGNVVDGSLAVSAAHPGRVCAALTTWDNTPTTETPLPTPNAAALTAQAGQLPISYPPPRPLDVWLLASDDSGQTWHGARVLALRRYFGGVVGPGVSMSADGACSLATSQAGGPFGQSSALANLWRLAPGATQPTALWTMTDRSLLNLFLAPGSAGGGERIIALTRIAGPHDGQTISCGPGCQTMRDDGSYRLIWQPLPSV